MRKKDFDYFQAFCRIGALAEEASAYLHTVLTQYRPQELSRYFTELHEIERQADGIKHEIAEHLAREFLPPLHREDITALSRTLDLVVDYTEEVMRRIYMFQLPAISGDMQKLTALLAESCVAFRALLTEFARFRKSVSLPTCIRRIGELESEGDLLHAESVRRLFGQNALPPHDLLAGCQVLDTLEESLDACEHAADLIGDVVLKHT